MKKIIVFLCMICMMLCLCSCHPNNIHLNKEKSFFSDFKIENDKVYIYCTLFIENQSDAEKDVVLQASLENDAKNGLLKEATIKGYSIDEGVEPMKLQKGENQIDIVFIGEYGGKPEKVDRLLPDIEIIEIDS